MTEIALPHAKRRRRRPMTTEEKAYLIAVMLLLLSTFSYILSIILGSHQLRIIIIFIIGLTLNSTFIIYPWKVVYNYIVNGFIDD